MVHEGVMPDGSALARNFCAPIGLRSLSGSERNVSQLRHKAE